MLTIVYATISRENGKLQYFVITLITLIFTCEVVFKKFNRILRGVALGGMLV